jgi:hypothetical protein
VVTTKSADRDGRLWPELAVVVGLIAVFVVGLVVIDNRLDSIEERLAYRPPITRAPSSSPSTVQLSSDSRAVYVPAYSHIYSLGGQAVLLEMTLSVRNVDPQRSISLSSVLYFDTDGNLLRSFLQEGQMDLGPMATVEFLVEEKDVTGGSGANFVVEWIGEEGANPPLVEAVMVGRDGTHGLAFRTEGREIVR